MEESLPKSRENAAVRSVAAIFETKVSHERYKDHMTIIHCTWLGRLHVILLQHLY